jgi:hypothetical protein
MSYLCGVFRTGCFPIIKKGKNHANATTKQ